MCEHLGTSDSTSDKADCWCENSHTFGYVSCFPCLGVNTDWPSLAGLAAVHIGARAPDVGLPRQGADAVLQDLPPLIGAVVPLFSP